MDVISKLTSAATYHWQPLCSAILEDPNMLSISGILFRKLFTIVNGTATVVDIRPRNAGKTSDDAELGAMRTGLWSEPEHDRFLEGVAMYPNGPWLRIAAHVGTRTTKQTRIHAHKYCQKIERHLRGLQRGRGWRASSAGAYASPAATSAVTTMFGVDQGVEASGVADTDTSALDDPDAIFTRLDDGEQLQVLPDDIDYAAVDSANVPYDCEPLAIDCAPWNGSDDKLVELLFTPSTTSDASLAWPLA